MVKRVFLLLGVLIGCAFFSFAQSSNIEAEINERIIDLGRVEDGNEDFSGFDTLKVIFRDVEIVMLGEQSHGDATTFETKIKLVKYLHQELGFDILAFESGFYDCQKAWSEIQMGNDVATSLAKSVFDVWSMMMEFRPLADYIEENKYGNHPLILSGFDSQFTGKISSEKYIDDLRKVIAKKDSSILETGDWTTFENSLQRFTSYDVKKIDKDDAIKDTTYINYIIDLFSSSNLDSLSDFWIQSLTNAKYFISDTKLKTYFRDEQMAQNLIWIKEHNPDKKIICWGATSHFLYNAEEVKLIKFPYNIADNFYQKETMMGHYIKDYYGARVYTIGFIAYEGTYGAYKGKKIPKVHENSLEALIGKSKYDNCFLPLNGLNLEGVLSRPLGHAYMETNIGNVMDGVIFNRYMDRPFMDANLFLEIYPDNKWIKPVPEPEDEDSE
jgi:erythromycin esterase